MEENMQLIEYAKSLGFSVEQDEEAIVFTIGQKRILDSGCGFRWKNKKGFGMNYEPHLSLKEILDLEAATQPS